MEMKKKVGEWSEVNLNCIKLTFFLLICIWEFKITSSKFTKFKKGYVTVLFAQLLGGILLAIPCFCFAVMLKLYEEEDAAPFRQKVL